MSETFITTMPLYLHFVRFLDALQEPNSINHGVGIPEGRAAGPLMLDNGA